MSETAAKRESRKWWAIVDGDVCYVTGYSCAPNTPGYWWCPEAGYSLSEKYHLFINKREALQEALKENEEEIAELIKLNNKLRNQIAIEQRK